VWAFSIETPQGPAELFVDGVSLSVVRISGEKGPFVPLLTDDVFAFEFENVTFIALKCPVCGWDLPFHPYSVIHLCSTCGRAWSERRGAFQEVAYHVVKRQDESQELFAYFPFWTIQVCLLSESAKLTTMADFYRYFPVPRVINWEEEKNKPIRFYIPAFRIKNIPVVNKFSAVLTRNQPEYSYSESDVLLEHDKGDVFLSAKEAREMAEIVLCSLVPKGSRKAKDLVNHGELRVVLEQLEWFPFREKGISYLDQTTGYALQKAAVEIH
jgi:hypothetical protein